tara:strand:- start:3898 stop:4044 length:147 start_codon:yes stop_codon:yes gene_type:complete
MACLDMPIVFIPVSKSLKKLPVLGMWASISLPQALWSLKDSKAIFTRR